MAAISYRLTRIYGAAVPIFVYNSEDENVPWSNTTFSFVKENVQNTLNGCQEEYSPWFSTPGGPSYSAFAGYQANDLAKRAATYFLKHYRTETASPPSTEQQSSLPSTKFPARNVIVELAATCDNFLYNVIQSLLVRTTELREQVRLSTKEQLEQVGLTTKEQLEQVRLSTKEQLERVRLSMKEQLEQVGLSTKEQLEQVRLSTKEQLEQVDLDLLEQVGLLTKEELEQVDLSTKKQLEQVDLSTKKQLKQVDLSTKKQLEQVSTKEQLKQVGLKENWKTTLDFFSRDLIDCLPYIKQHKPEIEVNSILGFQHNNAARKTWVSTLKVLRNRFIHRSPYFLETDFVKMRASVAELGTWNLGAEAKEDEVFTCFIMNVASHIRDLEKLIIHKQPRNPVV